MALIAAAGGLVALAAHRLRQFHESEVSNQ
jgi:hypothetical protein